VQSIKVGIIFKHSIIPSVQLLVDGLTAIVDSSNTGLAFASIDIKSNTALELSIKGSGVLDNYEICFMGDGVVVDSTAQFGCDWIGEYGLAVLADGGNVYCHAIKGQDIAQPRLLMVGSSVDVSFFGNEFFVSVVDYASNIWLIVLNKDFEITNTRYLASGADRVAINCTQHGMYLAILKVCKVKVGKIVNNSILVLRELDNSRVKNISWIKQINKNCLVLGFADKKNIVLQESETIVFDNSVRVVASVGFVEVGYSWKN